MDTRKQKDKYIDKKYKTETGKIQSYNDENQPNRSKHTQLTMILETAKVMPAWLGATSTWLLRWPEELQALMPIDKVMKLEGGGMVVWWRCGRDRGVWCSGVKKSVVGVGVVQEVWLSEKHGVVEKIKWRLDVVDFFSRLLSGYKTWDYHSYF